MAELLLLFLVTPFVAFLILAAFMIAVLEDDLD